MNIKFKIQLYFETFYWPDLVKKKTAPATPGLLTISIAPLDHLIQVLQLI